MEPTPGYEEHTASGYPYPQTTPLVTMITEEDYPYTTTTESYVAAKEVTTMTTRVPYRYPTTTPEPYDDYFPAPEVYDDEGICLKCFCHFIGKLFFLNTFARLTVHGKLYTKFKNPFSLNRLSHTRHIIHIQTESLTCVCCKYYKTYIFTVVSFTHGG